MNVLGDTTHISKRINELCVDRRVYGGIKYTDDVHDALTLCELRSIGRLPTGFVCPKDTRAVRDLLRRRGLFVNVRRSLMLSVQGMFARITGKKYSFSKIDKSTTKASSRRSSATS